MPFLIDGHNLIGRAPGLSLADPDDEAELVRRIQQYCRRHRRRATVVFDAGVSGGRSGALSTPELEVVFASSGRRADDVIRERLRRARDPAGWIVVSSDREIQRVARQAGARVVSSEEFVAEMRASPPAPHEERAPRLSEDEIQEWLDLFQRRK
ncbi:MAG: NYN domain-containing protein [Thermoflexales bacterium]|nr:NYN domain-containing protein [Thermoflexales bacterium]